MTVQLNISKAIKQLSFLGLVFSGAASTLAAQDSVEWTTLGNDYGNTRYTTSQEITSENSYNPPELIAIAAKNKTQILKQYSYEY